MMQCNTFERSVRKWKKNWYKCTIVLNFIITSYHWWHSTDCSGLFLTRSWTSFFISNMVIVFTTLGGPIIYHIVIVTFCYVIATSSKPASTCNLCRLLCVCVLFSVSKMPSKKLANRHKTGQHGFFFFPIFCVEIPRITGIGQILSFARV